MYLNVLCQLIFMRTLQHGMDEFDDGNVFLHVICVVFQILDTLPRKGEENKKTGLFPFLFSPVLFFPPFLW